MISVFCLFKSCRQIMIAGIFMKSIRRISGFQREKIMTELNWLEVTLFMMLLAWTINLTWVDKAIQENEKIRFLMSTSAYISNASVFYSTFQMLWCISSEPRCEFLLLCKLMIILTNVFTQFPSFFEVLGSRILRKKKTLMSCSHWMIMGDRWLDIYWIYIVVYIYQRYCWEAHLMSCISCINFEAF